MPARKELPQQKISQQGFKELEFLCVIMCPFLCSVYWFGTSEETEAKLGGLLRPLSSVLLSV